MILKIEDQGRGEEVLYDDVFFITARRNCTYQGIDTVPIVPAGANPITSWNFLDRNGQCFSVPVDNFVFLPVGVPCREGEDPHIGTTVNVITAFRNSRDPFTVVFNNAGYLMNDNGKTVERY